MKSENIMEMKFGKPQSVGNMTMIPIVSNTEFTEMSEEMLFHISNDNDYSHLTLKNADNKYVIVPQGTSFITKQEAQDRAILSAHVIKPGKENIVNVGCVESSQGGHISSGTEETTFIPATIRIPAMEKDDVNHNYDVLWKDIEKYTKNAGIASSSHINTFYNHFEKELEEFVASFENVDKQIGAVIIINNQVVGIEIFPNYQNWIKVWRNLIRDSYGADAISMIKQNKVIAIRPIINLDKISDIETLEIEMNKITTETLKLLKQIVNDTINNEIQELSQFNRVDDFAINNISMGEMKGQIIKKSDKPIYVTLMKSIV